MAVSAGLRQPDAHADAILISQRTAWPLNVPAPRLQRIVVQNDLSVNSKLFGFADNSCHQALAAKSFFVLRSRGPRRRVLVRDVSERTAKR